MIAFDLNCAFHSWLWLDVWSNDTNFGRIDLRLVVRSIWSYDHLIERKRMALFTLPEKFHATASSADCRSFEFLVAYYRNNLYQEFSTADHGTLTRGPLT